MCLLPASLYCYHLSHKPVVRHFFLTVSKQLEGNGGYGYLTAGLVNRSPAQQRGEWLQTGVNLLQSYLNWTIYRVLGKTSPLRGNSDFKVNSPWFVCLFVFSLKNPNEQNTRPKTNKENPKPKHLSSRYWGLLRSKGGSWNKEACRRSFQYRKILYKLHNFLKYLKEKLQVSKHQSSHHLDALRSGAFYLHLSWINFPWHENKQHFLPFPGYAMTQVNKNKHVRLDLDEGPHWGLDSHSAENPITT